MKNYPKYLKSALDSVIHEMGKHPEDFCRNPGRDFTRDRKLPFENMLSLLVKMGGHALRDEMLDYFGCNDDLASVSAFVQQRNKILPKALVYLFHKFSDTCVKPKLYKGFRLLAVDGSDLQYTADPTDTQSYFAGTNGHMHYSVLHLNALYDLNSHCYLDAVIQKRRSWDERNALIQMIERFQHDTPSIVIADRGYESYNVLEYISRLGMYYLIRVRDTKSIVSPIPLPDGDLDLPVQLQLARKQNKVIKALQAEHPGMYRSLPTNVHFDFLPPGSNELYPISFRIIRFRLSEDTTETLITNLGADLFSAEEIRYLYHLRWGVETAFRQLKHTIGLRQFQSKKVENITQEIFARLTMYNFCELITSHVAIQKKRGKLVYQTNFSAAVHICRQFLRGAVPPPKVEALIKRQVVPIRPGRSTPRKPKNVKFNGFLYRIA